MSDTQKNEQSSQDAGQSRIGSSGMLSEVLFEFLGGPMDGEKIRRDEWPKNRALPRTEILDKCTGSLYRYHHSSSEQHPVYTYRINESR